MKKMIINFLSELAIEKGIIVTDDLDLFESGILDSMGIISLLAFLQDELNISINIENLQEEHFQTVRSILDFVQESGK